MEGPNRPDGEPDNWWWLILTGPHGAVHLYELGYAGRDEDGASVPLTEERHAEILAEIGATPEVLASFDEDGWRQEMAPGRPNRFLHPKSFGPDGELLPIRPLDGVTLHLLAPDAQAPAP
ncbi:MAG TPA: hypothetical protein VFY84_19225 [Jiangellales bacterium]|nr:hypothetical protein [Jiangellales bacterium]